MADGVRVRAKQKDGVTQVRTLIKHPMETGTREDSDTGELVPAHYIREVTAVYDGRVIMTAKWGPGVSRNPYWSFKFKGGRKGETVTIRWVDNLGGTGSGEAEIE